MVKRKSFVLLWSVLGAILFLPGLPQSVLGQVPGEVFSEVFDVRVVNLEVVVTDKQGNRVTGLAPTDFELLVDGEITEVEFFSEVRDRTVGKDQEGYLASYGEGSEGPLSTNYLVFVDDYFSVTQDRNRVVEGLLDQLDSLSERDRMAVVRFNGRRLEMLQGWTNAKLRVEEALNEVAREPAGGLKRLAEIRRVGVSGDVGFQPLGGSANELTLEERYTVDRLTGQVERAVSAATSALRSVGRPSGRNVMLLLSGGWPYNPAEYVVDDVGRLLSERIPDGGIFAPLIDTANLLGFTLYPVDVPGLETIGTRSPFDERTSTDLLRPNSFYRESSLHQTLQFLAEETGGQAFLNAGRKDALANAREDTASFYSLGFSAPRAGDDQEHRTEVRVLKPGLKVRSRKGFLDFSRSREVTLAVESALYFGAPPSEQPLRVRLGKAKRSGLRSMTVDLELQIPAAAMTFLPSAEGNIASLELRVAVLDKDGAKADTPVIPLVFRRKSDPSEPATGFVPYSTTLKLRRKPQDLVVAVYDIASGEILSSVLEVRP